MNHVASPLSSADISNFSQEVCKFCYIKKYGYRLHFDTSFLVLSTFFETVKTFSIGYNFDNISAKMATPGLFKMKTF